jgi:hypothetical protein
MDQDHQPLLARAHEPDRAYLVAAVGGDNEHCIFQRACLLPRFRECLVVDKDSRTSISNLNTSLRLVTELVNPWKQKHINTEYIIFHAILPYLEKEK